MKLKLPLLFIPLLLIILFKSCSSESNREKSAETKIKKENEYYSFGLISALNTKKLIIKNKYHEAETLIKSLNSDDLTQVLDYIALSSNETVLLNWLNESKNPNIPNLFLGVFYNHQAWRARTHSWAKDVSEERILSFIEYQKKSINNFLSIEKNSPFIEETNSRLVRHYMGEGSLKKSKEHFKKTIALNNENIWVYIHYCEVIQPKWGGNLKDIKDLLNNLPKRKLIKQIVSLKLALDSYISNENYFGGTMDELDNIANQLLVEIDKQVTESPPRSIHRYIVYNYLFALAEELKNNPLQFKNYQKMNEFFTLYPYGIQV